MPESRRQRKGRLKPEQTNGDSIQSADDIPLARPAANTNKTAKPGNTKTLVDLVEEHAVKLKLPDGSPALPPLPTLSPAQNEDANETTDGGIEDFPLFLVRALITAFPLSIFNLLLTYLINSLYLDTSADVPLLRAVIFHLPEMLTRTFPLLAILSLSVQLLGGTIPKRYRTRVEQTGWCLVSTIAGCWMVFVIERRGYMAVMKYAPGAGTIWIWSNVEMGVEGCVLSGVVVVAWAAFLGAFS